MTTYEPQKLTLTELYRKIESTELTDAQLRAISCECECLRECAEYALRIRQLCTPGATPVDHTEAIL